jgi:hypothetical protein
MIGEGMPVQIRRCGTSTPVEKLTIGDLVYDPMNDNYHELIDILSRNVSADHGQGVCIRAGIFRPGIPSRDINVSLEQCIGVSISDNSRSSARIEFRPAHTIGSKFSSANRFYVLFPERSCCISVAGVILHLFDLTALIKGAPAPLRPPSSSASGTRQSYGGGQ